MALRDKQIGGVPLTKAQSFVVALLCTACVPVIAYMFWFQIIPVPEELHFVVAGVGTLIHLAMSTGSIEPGKSRAQLFFGTYTGEQFLAGIYLIPRLPFPVILLAVRILCSEAVYQNIFWSMEGDVRVESISATFSAEGITRDGARVCLNGRLVLEIENVGVFRSQTRDDTDRQTLIGVAVAEYESQVKFSVIQQHTVIELMQGLHSGGSDVLNRWMTEAWDLVRDFGVSLARSPVTEVKILSDQVQRAFDLANAREIMVGSMDAVGEAIAALKRRHPDLTETELAMIYPSVFGGGSNMGVNIHNVKLK